MKSFLISGNSFKYNNFNVIKQRSKKKRFILRCLSAIFMITPFILSKYIIYSGGLGPLPYILMYNLQNNACSTVLFNAVVFLIDSEITLLYT